MNENENVVVEEPNVEETPTVEEAVEHVEGETVDLNLNQIPNTVEVKKVGSARLIFNDATVIYKFDIHFNSKYNSLEFKNVINNFEELKPRGSKGMQEFFAAYGIINWNFPKTILAINTNEYLEAMTKIENLVNGHIKGAGLKKFVFRVDTV